MSKVIAARVEKRTLLIEGFRRHVGELNEWGMEEAELNAMSEQLREQSMADDACAELWQKLTGRVRIMNESFADARVHYHLCKRMVKENFPQ